MAFIGYLPDILSWHVSSTLYLVVIGRQHTNVHACFKASDYRLVSPLCHISEYPQQAACHVKTMMIKGLRFRDFSCLEFSTLAAAGRIFMEPAQQRCMQKGTCHAVRTECVAGPGLE